MSAEHKKGKEKHRAVKWLGNRFKEVSDAALKAGIAGFVGGVLIDVVGTILGFGPPIRLGKTVVKWGLIVGAGGLAGRLIGGKPGGHGH